MHRHQSFPYIECPATSNSFCQSKTIFRLRPGGGKGPGDEKSRPLPIGDVRTGLAMLASRTLFARFRSTSSASIKSCSRRSLSRWTLSGVARVTSPKSIKRGMPSAPIMMLPLWMSLWAHPALWSIFKAFLKWVFCARRKVSGLGESSSRSNHRMSCKIWESSTRSLDRMTSMHWS